MFRRRKCKDCAALEARIAQLERRRVEVKLDGEVLAAAILHSDHFDKAINGIAHSLVYG